MIGASRPHAPATRRCTCWTIASPISSAEREARSSGVSVRKRSSIGRLPVIPSVARAARDDTILFAGTRKEPAAARRIVDDAAQRPIVAEALGQVMDDKHRKRED